MKNNSSIGIMFRFAVIGLVIGVFVSQYMRIERMEETLNTFMKQQVEFKNGVNASLNESFLMHIISARQIQTLYNIELRRNNPEIQKKLEEERKKYKELDQVSEESTPS